MMDVTAKKFLFPVFFLVVAVLLFSPFALTQTVPYVGDYSGSDLYELNLPFRIAAADSWRHGEVPIWSQQLAHGFPLLAEGQAGVFYPLNVFFVFLPWPMALVTVLVLNFFLAGLFTYLLARAYGISREGACIAALAFSFGGFFIFRLKHLNLINAAIWLPLVFYIIEWVFKKNRVIFSAIMLGAVLAVQFFAGHPQVTYLTVIASSAYTVIRWRWIRLSQSEKKMNWQKLVLFWFIAGAFALSLSAVQLLPTLELAHHSGRGQWASYNDSVKLHYSPLELLTFINPYIFGNPATDTYSGFNLQLRGGFWEDTLYIGIVPLLLAMLALVNRRSKVTALMAILIGVSFFFMFAQLNPLFPLTWVLVPGMRIFRFFQRFSFVFVLALAILSGVGFDTIVKLLKKLPPTFKTVFVRRGTVIVILLVIVIDLFWVGWQYFGAVPSTYFDEPASAAWLKKDTDSFRVASLLYQRSWESAYSFNSGWANTPDVFIDQRSVVQPNLNLVWGIESINDRGWDEGGQLDAHLSTLLKMHNRNWSFNGKTLTISTSSIAILGMQNAKYLISFYDVSGPGLTLVRQVPQMLLPAVRVYRNNEALPRAFLVGTSTVVATDDGESTALFDRAFNPRQNVIIDHALLGQDFSGPLDATATVETSSARVVTVNATASRPAILFLSNLNYPGWNATVDGVPTEIVRANLAFMAVAVPAGTHKVIFSYQPKSFLFGSAISSIALGLLILSAVWWCACRRTQLPTHG